LDAYVWLPAEEKIVFYAELLLFEVQNIVEVMRYLRCVLKFESSLILLISRQRKVIIDFG